MYLTLEKPGSMLPNKNVQENIQYDIGEGRRVNITVLWYKAVSKELPVKRCSSFAGFSNSEDYTERTMGVKASS